MQNRLFRAALAAIAALCALPAAAQYTTVTTTYLGGSHNLVASATIYWQPMQGCTAPPGAGRIGTTSGQILGTPQTATVTAGVSSIVIPDALLTSPNIGYAVTVVDNNSGQVLLGAGLSGVYVTPGGPYGCIQPTGSTWNFDVYSPPTGTTVPSSGGTVSGPTTFDSSVLFTSAPVTFGSASSGAGSIYFNDNAWDHAIDLVAPSTLGSNYTLTLPAATANLMTSVGGDGVLLSSVQQSASIYGQATIPLLSQSANCVVAGPSSGSALQPTCRSLVAADVTPAGTLTNNTSGNAANVTGTVAKANGGTGGNTSSIDANCLSATAVQYGCTVFDSGILNYTWTSGTGAGQLTATMTGTPAAGIYEFCGSLWTSTAATGGNWILYVHSYPGSFFNSSAEANTTLLTAGATSANKEFAACLQVESDGTHLLYYELYASSITGSPGILHYRFTIRRIN